MEEILASIRRILAEDEASDRAASGSPMPGERTDGEDFDSPRELLAEAEALYASLSLDSEPAIDLPSGAAGMAFRTLEFFGPSGEARAGCLLECYHDRLRLLGPRGAGGWLFWQAFWMLARLVWGLIARLIQFDEILRGPHLR